MSNRNFLKRLEGMKGKTFQYANQIHYLLDYKIDEQHEKCTIKTNLKTFERSYGAVDEFLSYWIEASSVQALVPIPADKQLEIYRSEENTTADKLIAILEDNITKVQSSPAYIPQATSINNNINSIINIQKMKIDFMKSARKTK